MSSPVGLVLESNAISVPLGEDAALEATVELRLRPATNQQALCEARLIQVRTRASCKRKQRTNVTEN